MAPSSVSTIYPPRNHPLRHCFRVGLPRCRRMSGVHVARVTLYPKRAELLPDAHGFDSDEFQVAQLKAAACERLPNDLASCCNLGGFSIFKISGSVNTQCVRDG